MVYETQLASIRDKVRAGERLSAALDTQQEQAARQREAEAARFGAEGAAAFDEPALQFFQSADIIEIGLGLVEGEGRAAAQRPTLFGEHGAHRLGVERAMLLERAPKDPDRLCDGQAGSAPQRFVEPLAGASGAFFIEDLGEAGLEFGGAG